MVKSIEANDIGGMNLSSRASAISSGIIVILVFSAVGGYVFLTNQYVPSHIAVVTTEPGFGDRSMADQAYEGLFHIEVVVDYDYYVAADVADLQDTIDEIAGNHNHDLILVIGTEVGLADAVSTVASTYPNEKFGFIGGFVDLPNVASATFEENEAAFLAGALAAHLAVDNVNRTGVVGIIGSVSSDTTVNELIDGFLQGLHYANQTLQNVILLPTVFIESYNDSATAEEYATDMWDPAQGRASVIFAPVRASITGIRAAMEYANETWFGIENGNNHEPFVLAAEGDQRYMGNPNIEIATGPSWVVTSIVQRSDLAVYRIINATLWGDFMGGLNYGAIEPGMDADHGGSLADDQIGLADLEEFWDEEWVTISMINMTTDYRLAIINGTIEVT